MMGMEPVFVGHPFVERQFHFQHGLAGRQPRAVGDAEHMGIDRDGAFAIDHIENHIGRLAADAGQFFQLFARLRHLAFVVCDQRLRQRDHVLRLAAIKPDGLDVFEQLLFAQRHHLFGRIGNLEQFFGRAD